MYIVVSEELYGSATATVVCSTPAHPCLALRFHAIYPV